MEDRTVTIIKDLIRISATPRRAVYDYGPTNRMRNCERPHWGVPVFDLNIHFFVNFRP